MAEIINLRRFRKSKARQEASQEAEQNRITYGRSKEEREESAKLRKLHEQRVDAQKLDRNDDEKSD